jgi:small conductance mechanosensitive channel
MWTDLDPLKNLIVVYGINFVGAIVVAIVGWWLARVVQRAVRRALTASSRVDPTLVGFLSSFAFYAVLVVVFWSFSSSSASRRPA